MRRTGEKWGYQRLGMSILAVSLVALSWWRVLAVDSGLISRSLEWGGVPMRFLASEAADNTPGVVIAHGYGASQQIMLGYAYALARAGYGVMLFDFDGHAANVSPFDPTDRALQQNLDSAYAALLAQPEIDPERMALLGHSMGGGVVMRAAVRDVDRYQATIAVSASNADVSPERPRNLLLMPGAWEGSLLDSSRELLAKAGGSSEEFASGGARALVIVPWAEHILVLFSPFAHETAINWLNRAFGEQFATGYRDLRMIWFGLSLAGWVLLAIAVAPWIRSASLIDKTRYRGRWPWLALAIMPFIASVIVALINLVMPISEFGGIQVGGALSTWFLIMGLGWLLVGFRIPRLNWKQFGMGIALFVFLWIGVGLMSQTVWLQWYLTPARLVRWPFMALAYLPWLLAAGLTQSGKTALSAAGWWLAQNAFIIGGLLFMVILIPSLFVVLLALPVVPLLIGLMMIAGAAVDHPWAFAIGNALFFGWQMSAYFPYIG